MKPTRNLNSRGYPPLHIEQILSGILIMLGLLFSTFSEIYAQDTPPLRFHHLTTQDGLSAGNISCVLEDEFGFIWFGTWNGLDRYDGYEITHYRHDPDNANSLSNNDIRTCYQDKDGTFWLGTTYGLNHFDPASLTFTRYYHDADDIQTLNDNWINYVYQDNAGDIWVATHGASVLNHLAPKTGIITRYQDNSNTWSQVVDSGWGIRQGIDGTLWMATSNAGLVNFDPATATFTHYQHDPDNPASLPSEHVFSVYVDRDNRLWVGHTSGLSEFIPNTQTFVHHLAIDNDPRVSEVTSMLEDEYGQLWLGFSNTGLGYYNKQNHNLITYHYDPANPYSINTNKIYTLYQNQSGTIWAAGLGTGASFFNLHQKKFDLYQHNPEDTASLISNRIISMHMDDSGTLWVGTSAPGALHKIDLRTRHVTRYAHDPNNPQSLNNDASIEAITTDRKGNVWVGSWGGGLSYLDQQTGIFTHYLHNPNDPQSLPIPDNVVLALHIDAQGGVWLDSWTGELCRFDPATQTFTRYDTLPNCPPALVGTGARFIYEDMTGRLWIGTFNVGLHSIDPQTKQFQSYQHNPADPHSISKGSVYAIYEDDSGALWVGTTGGLNRLDPERTTFTHYTEQHGLPGDIVHGILGDATGNLWLSTNHGLSKFNPQTETFTNYDIWDGLQDNEFMLHAYAQGSDGQMFFGGVNGFNSFYPADIIANTYQPPVVLTDFKLFNHSVTVGEDTLLQQPIWTMPNLILKPEHDIIAFEFSALNYLVPEKSQYQYQLEGYETQWNTVDYQQRFASYTSLPAGDYVFRVRGTNNDGLWSDKEVALNLTVIPPWWATWWARLLAIILVVATIIGNVQWRIHRVQQRNRELEVEVTRRTRDLHKSERAMTTLLSNLPGIAYRCKNDFQWTMQFISDGCEDLTGYPATAFINNATRSYADLIHPDDRDKVWQQIQTALDEKRGYQLTYRIVTKEEKIKWVWEQGQGVFSTIEEAKTGHNEPGTLLALEGLINDITTRILAERALRTSEERFATVMNSIEALIYVTDMETHQILFINEYTRRIFGDVVGQICWQVLQNGQTGPCPFCTNTSLVADGKPTGLHAWEFQNTVTGRWYHLQDRAIWWLDGRLVRLEIATDITALKQAEIQRHQLAAFEERERIGRELHDDLGQVIGYINLQAQTALTHLSEKHLHQAESSLTQLIQVAQDAHHDVREYILDIRHPQTVAHDFMANLEKHLITLKQHYNLHVYTHFPETMPDQPFIPEVATQLLRILQESLTNVAKHAHINEATLTLTLDKDWAVAVIEDKGIGFNLKSQVLSQKTDTQKAISDNQQLAIALPSSFGLSIMRERATSVGGTLDVQSAPNTGTRLIVRVPRTLTQPVPAPDIHTYNGRALNVMLVDDHPLFLDGLRNMLSSRGVQIVGLAHNGNEALPLALQLRPDVILMDVNMPGCDGVQATRNILAELPEQKIVMLTVAADDETLFSALKSGASGYLLKNLNSETLFQMLTDLMEGEVVIAPSLASRVLLEFTQQTKDTTRTESTAAKTQPTPTKTPVGQLYTDKDTISPLTSRQIEVLQLVAQGMTYRATALQLHVTERTVKYHMGEILKRLHLKSRAQAIGYAVEKGLTTS